ncbi:MAG: sugar phosphate isomerase/epimerase family protein [Planctomycetota bacterium]
MTGLPWGGPAASQPTPGTPALAAARLTRRDLLAAAAVALAATRTAHAAPRRRGIPLGFDNFAVRACGWNARQLVDHAEALRCDSLFITDFGPFEGRLDDASLGELRRYAADKGIGLVLGSWSICPTSKTFKQDWGTPEEHLALGIRAAQALGSPAFRVVLGNQEDRKGAGGIAARIADTLAVLQEARPRAEDAGVKIALENHAGDMTSRELAGLVTEAGGGVVGVNFDSGNACWTLEDPVRALENLAPHVVTTSLRDTMIWFTPEPGAGPVEEGEPAGVTCQWAALGEGCTDLAAFFDRFEQACPGVAVHIETISGFPRLFPIFDRDFWNLFPDSRADELAAFLALARRGRPLAPFRPPAGAAKAAAEREYQLGELTRSIAYCRDVLGLGLRS